MKIILKIIGVERIPLLIRLIRVMNPKEPRMNILLVTLKIMVEVKLKVNPFPFQNLCSNPIWNYNLLKMLLIDRHQMFKILLDILRKMEENVLIRTVIWILRTMHQNHIPLIIILTLILLMVMKCVS